RHACRLEDRARDALDIAAGKGQCVHAMAKAEAEQAAGLRLAGAALEGLDNARTCAPADMKPWHRIAVAHGVVAAALRPADHGKDAVSHGAQPAPLFACRECHISLGPAPRPMILIAVESG